MRRVFSIINIALAIVIVITLSFGLLRSGIFESVAGLSSGQSQQFADLNRESVQDVESPDASTDTDAEKTRPGETHNLSQTKQSSSDQSGRQTQEAVTIGRSRLDAKTAQATETFPAEDTSSQAPRQSAGEAADPEGADSDSASAAPDSTKAATTTIDNSGTASDAASDSVAASATTTAITTIATADPTTTATSTAATTTAAATTTTAAVAASGTSPLKGKVICIDPGHQKKQNSSLEPVAPGSSTKKAKVSSGTAGVSSKTAEYVVTLAVGLKLKTLLEKEGATVVMTRESHDVDVSNVERAEIGNKAGADLAVRIHADGSENSSVKGISMLVPASGTLSDSLVKSSKKAGTVVLEKVINKTGAKNRGVIERSDMTGFNWSAVPVILIEMGFMSNAEEDRLLVSDDYQNKLAAGLSAGITAYFQQQ